MMMMMIRQFIRRRNMSRKSLEGRRTPGSSDECRTAQTAADPWTKPTDLSHWPACRQLRNYNVGLILYTTHYHYSYACLVFAGTKRRLQPQTYFLGS